MSYEPLFEVTLHLSAAELKAMHRLLFEQEPFERLREMIEASCEIARLQRLLAETA